MRNYDLFNEVLSKVKDGMSITFTKDNVAYGDDFLILGCRGHESCTVTFKRKGLLWVEFSNDEPMLLENCPDSFYESILKNIG